MSPSIYEFCVDNWSSICEKNSIATIPFSHVGIDFFLKIYPRMVAEENGKTYTYLHIEPADASFYSEKGFVLLKYEAYVQDPFENQKITWIHNDPLTNYMGKLGLFSTEPGSRYLSMDKLEFQIYIESIEIIPKT